jgi:rhodanese-related sulfurtransferase
MEPFQAFARRDEVRFLDVREYYEFDAGHIEGAVHIPLRRLPELVQTLDKERPVVVACQIGQRSDLAARFLREKGFDAHNLEGGMTLWVEQGLPILSGEGSSGTVVDGWAQVLE